MLSDKMLNDPPWVVEIDGVKFATPEPVVLLLKEVSEERDALEAQNEGYGQLLGSANNDVERLTEYADKLEAQLAALREATDALPARAAEQFGWGQRLNFGPEQQGYKICDMLIEYSELLESLDA